MRLFTRRHGPAPALLGAALLAALAGAGCSSSSDTNTARARTVDLATNAGTATIQANGSAPGGDLNFGESSPYDYIGGGDSTFTYTTTAVTPTGLTAADTPLNPTFTLSNGSFYTAYLIGRADVAPLSASKPDPRFLQVAVTGDRGAAANYAGAVVYADPPSGQSNVRILNGAPDAGPVDVLVNGHAAFPAVTYPALPTLVGGTTTARATAPATIYQAFPGGTVSVQVNKAGTATALVPPTSVPVSGGRSYTVVVTEPTVAPTFGLSVQTDGPQ